VRAGAERRLAAVNSSLLGFSASALGSAIALAVLRRDAPPAVALFSLVAAGVLANRATYVVDESVLARSRALMTELDAADAGREATRRALREAVRDVRQGLAARQRVAAAVVGVIEGADDANEQDQGGLRKPIFKALEHSLV